MLKPLEHKQGFLWLWVLHLSCEGPLIPQPEDPPAIELAGALGPVQEQRAEVGVP